jgi:hypothetical protein
LTRHVTSRSQGLSQRKILGTRLDQMMLLSLPRPKALYKMFTWSILMAFTVMHNFFAYTHCSLPACKHLRNTLCIYLLLCIAPGDEAVSQHSTGVRMETRQTSWLLFTITIRDTEIEFLSKLMDYLHVCLPGSKISLTCKLSIKLKSHFQLVVVIGILQIQPITWEFFIFMISFHYQVNVCNWILMMIWNKV